MIPILRPSDVKAIDERALMKETLDEILARVGKVVANHVVDMVGSASGAKLIALVGPGLNGADAKAAAALLRGAGADVMELDALDLPATLPAADLIIDGAFGIGLSRAWVAPQVGNTPVLAIDLPSGIDGISGAQLGSALKARRTVTLGGYKAGMLFGDGPEYSGEVLVGDIGLGGNDVRTRLVEESDVARWLPVRPAQAHKWNYALLTVAGSSGMTGAARLCTAAAMRSGSGYVHLLTLADPDPGLPAEVVRSSAADEHPDPSRFKAAVLGPGLGRSPTAGDLVRRFCTGFEGPVLIDGDGLTAVATHPDLVTARQNHTILTPHDGEFRRLMGKSVGSDRLESAMELAIKFDAVVLLKGRTIIVADPSGDVRVTNSGDQRLATAGTGDVLAGIIGGFLAQDVAPFDAATAGAYLHGATAMQATSFGMIASDLVDLIPGAYSRLAQAAAPNLHTKLG